MKTTKAKTLRGIRAWLGKRNTTAHMALVDWEKAEWVEVDSSGWIVAWGYRRDAMAIAA